MAVVVGLGWLLGTEPTGTIPASRLAQEMETPHLGCPFEGFFLPNLLHPISHPSHHNLLPPIACSYCSATSC